MVDEACKPREQELAGRTSMDSSACFWLRADHPLRAICTIVAGSWWLKAASLLLTLAFCVLQCFWDPLEPSDSGLNAAINSASLGITIAFTVEIVIKSLAWGFVLEDGESVSRAWHAVKEGFHGAWAGCLQLGSEGAAREQRLGRVLSAHLQGGLQTRQSVGTLELLYRQPSQQPLQPLQQSPRPPAALEQPPSPLEQSPQPPSPLEQPPQPSQQLHPRSSDTSPPDPPGQPQHSSWQPQDHTLEQPQPRPSERAPQQASEELPSQAPQQQQCDRVSSDSNGAELPSVEGRQESVAAQGIASGGSPALDTAQTSCQKLVAAADGPVNDDCQQQGQDLELPLPSAKRSACRQRPFLRDGWNQLDFVVVVASWITFLPGLGDGAGAARSLRLLLALRSLALFPGMKTCTAAVLHSLPMLANICVFTLFFMWLFGIIGLQLYQRPLHQNCFDVGADGQPLPFPPNDWDASAAVDPGYTPIDNEGVMCSTMDVWAGPHCSADQVCSQRGEPPQFGQLSFDNIAAGLVYCFFIITTMWWGMAASFLMEATAGWSFFYALLQVLIGWFMLSLILAVLGDQYLEAMKDEKRQQREDEEAAQRSGDDMSVGWASRMWQGISSKVQDCWQAQLPGFLAGSKSWRWRHWLQAIVGHWGFEATVISSVVANVVVLGMPYYGMSDMYASRLNTANTVLTFFFVAEAALKATALGRAYFMDPFNLYDFVVTAGALGSFFLESSSSASAASSGLSGLRAIRILRLLRLLTVLPALQRFLRVLVKVLWRTLAFFGIVALTVFLFALLGMMVLGGKWNPDTDPEAPRATFNSFGSSLVSVFETLTGSIEGTVWYAMYQTRGWAILYYMALTVIGNFLVLNLLVAILYELFLEESEGISVKKAAVKDWLIVRKLRRLAAAAACVPCNQKGATSAQQSAQSDSPETPASVAVDTPGAASLPSVASGAELPEVATDIEAATATMWREAADLRPFARTSSSGSYFKDPKETMASTSRLSSFQSDPPGKPAGPATQQGDSAAAKAWRSVKAWMARLASCGPEWKGATGPPLSTYQHRALWLLPPDNRLRRVVFSVVDDRRFEGLVLLVILFNCGVMAFESPGNSKNLANLLAKLEWGCLAFYLAEFGAKLVALGAWAEPGRSYFRSSWNWLDFLVIATSLLAALASDTTWVQGFRLLRVLRPLRLIGRSKQMKAVVGCLATSVVSMTHVLAVTILVQLVFAILGMQLYLGEMHYCTSDTCCVDAGDPGTCTTVITEQQCVGVSAGDAEPCMWTNEVFNFDNLWESLVTLTVLMTGAQEWSDTFYAASDTVGQGMQPQPNSATAVAAIYFAVYQCVAQFFLYNLFISVVLDAYTEQLERRGLGVMLTEGQKEWVKSQLHLLRDLPEPRDRVPSRPWRRRLHAVVTHALFNWFVLLCIMASGVTMSLQHFGQTAGWDRALQWSNNAFTITFCIESLLKLAALFPGRYFGDPWNCFDFVVTWGSVPSIFVSAGPAVGTLRALRALRLVRTIKYASGLRRIATTLFITLPTLANAALVLALFLFMFSVLGTQLFYGILPDEQILRKEEGMTVFFNWQNVGNAMMMLTNAATGDNWENLLADNMVQPPDCDPGSCGTRLASIFWMPFMVICSFLLLSIVLAVVVDAYTINKEPPEVSPENFQQFKGRWSELDPSGVGFINVAELHGLLMSVGYPLGYRNHPQGTQLPQDTNSFVKAMLQVDDDGSIYYHEVLQALTARAAGISIAALGHQVQRELREETRHRRERQRQRQLQLRRRQLQRQKRMQHAGRRRQTGTLSRIVETISRGGSLSPSSTTATVQAEAVGEVAALDQAANSTSPKVSLSKESSLDAAARAAMAGMQGSPRTPNAIPQG